MSLPDNYAEAQAEARADLLAARAELIQAAFDWLTDDRDPSTRDLLVLEGLRVADWIDTDEEAREIVRETVIGYGHLDDMRAFMAEHGLEKKEA